MIKSFLEYPLKIFKNDYVLRFVIWSVVSMGILLSISNILHYFFIDYFTRLESYLYVIKNTLYMCTQISIIAYFLSKFKFCILSLSSFYLIVFIRLLWFFKSKITYYNEILVYTIIFYWLLIAIHYINKIFNKSPKTKNVKK